MSSVLKRHLLERCRTYLFDCDGVLWKFNKLIPGAIELLSYLAQSGRRTILITNNSAKSTEQYAKKCVDLGLPVTPTNIMCSSNVAARHLHKTGIVGPVYVIGEAGIGLELDKCGITHFTIGPDVSDKQELCNGPQLDEQATCVLVGFDSLFDYRKLSKAVSYITKGVPFYATNDDAAIPSEHGVCPGTGSLVAAVRYATGKEPIIFGKPHEPMFSILQQDHAVNPEETLMIGDRLDTDILFGNKFGMNTACVLTGVTTPALLAKLTDEAEKRQRACPPGGSDDTANLLPHVVFDSVADMLQLLKEVDAVAKPSE